jgi:hypothetical protein
MQKWEPFEPLLASSVKFRQAETHLGLGWALFGRVLGVSATGASGLMGEAEVGGGRLAMVKLAGFPLGVNTTSPGGVVPLGSTVS